MKTILTVAAVAVLVAAIALGARSAFLDRAPDVTARADGVGADWGPPASGREDGAAEAVEPERSSTDPADADGSGTPAGLPAPAEPAAPRQGPAPAGSPAGDATAADVPARQIDSRDGSGAEEAEAVLRRAAAAYEAIGSLRADFAMRSENPLLRSVTHSQGTLYQRRPDRFLMRFSEPEGDVIVSDGTAIWVYYPSVNPQQVLRTRGGAGGAGGLDLQAQFLGDPVRRFAATLEGSESVNGRSARILLLEPREAVGYRSLRIWVDTQDHLVRRFEIVEENGAVRRVELRNLERNPRLGDELFRFTPPEGVRVVDR